MSIEIKIPEQKLSGYYTLEVVRSSGAVEKVAEFPNLITDAGLNGLGTTSFSSLAYYCAVGTGTTTPNVSQTSLVSQVGTRTSSRSTAATGIVDAENYIYGRYRYTFAIGQVTGNLAEIGLFDAPTAGTMFSRALIKDGSGNPTTITVLADEQLLVTYELRRYRPASDITGTVSITVDGTPTNYNYTIRAQRFNSTAAADSSYYWNFSRTPAMLIGYTYVYETDILGGVASSPSGTSAMDSSRSVAPYVANSFERVATATWNISSANFASGVGSCSFADNYGSIIYSGYQISFTPKLPKTNTKTLTLTFKTSWGRL